MSKTIRWTDVEVRCNKKIIKKFNNIKRAMDYVEEVYGYTMDDENKKYHIDGNLLTVGVTFNDDITVHKNYTIYKFFMSSYCGGCPYEECPRDKLIYDDKCCCLSVVVRKNITIQLHYM